MNKLRTAQVNRVMIVVLVLLAVVAGVFGFLRCRGGGEERQVTREIDQDFAARKFDMYCNTCQKVVREGVPQPEAAKINKDKQNGKLKCPECGNYTAEWGRGARAVIDTEEKPAP